MPSCDRSLAAAPSRDPRIYTPSCRRLTFQQIEFPQGRQALEIDILISFSRFRIRSIATTVVWLLSPCQQSGILAGMAR